MPILNFMRFCLLRGIKDFQKIAVPCESQLVFTCSKLTIKKLANGVIYVQNQQKKDTRTISIDMNTQLVDFSLMPSF